MFVLGARGIFMQEGKRCSLDIGSQDMKVASVLRPLAGGVVGLFSS